MKAGALFAAVVLACAAAPVCQAGAVPEAVEAYRRAARSRDIEAYTAAFAVDAVMVDVDRVFLGREDIRTWALREVIPNGESFEVLRVLDEQKGYAKTLVRWLSWEVLYYFWYDRGGLIRKMSLQYQEIGQTGKEDVYMKLTPAAKLYFDAVRAKSREMLVEAFAQNAEIRVVDRTFRGFPEIVRFAETEVFGGEYVLQKHISQRGKVDVIHLDFTPEGWSEPEPRARYEFTVEGDRIERMDLQYVD